jgi:hypothetical protein
MYSSHTSAARLAERNSRFAAKAFCFRWKRKESRAAFSRESTGVENSGKPGGMMLLDGDRPFVRDSQVRKQKRREVASHRVRTEARVKLQTEVSGTEISVAMGLVHAERDKL